MQDITERRHVELELRRSRENMLRAQHIAAMGSFERDLVTNKANWSDELFRIFGIEPMDDSPTFDTLLGLVHPEDRGWLEGTRRAELLGSPTSALEYRVVRPDGSIRIVRRECAVIFDDEKTPLRVYGTIQDITERKHAEIEVTRSRENMVRAQRIAALGSFEYNIGTGRTDWSDEMYRLLGLHKGEHKPGYATLIAMVHPQDREKFRMARDVGNKGSPSPPFEYRIIRPNGDERTLRRESDIVLGDDDQILRIFGTLQDITERRLSEGRERELERQLLHSQKLEALGTLAGGIAHDLNNTLVPIMALSKLTARRFPSGDQVRTNLETIFDASERARDLVRRVLAFSRKDDPEKHEVGLAEIVREALQLLRATVPTSIQLDASIADVPAIPADASQIHQIITNLVSNAAGAIGSEMGVITVSLDTQRTAEGKEEIRLGVADTGIGMNQATIQRMFEPFFTTKAVGQGTGLGLSIVHGIVTGHGGRIEVTSKLGKGSRFDLYFPIPDEAYAGMIAAVTASRPAA
jgi:PAS domain S-box-containing protein